MKSCIRCTREAPANRATCAVCHEAKLFRAKERADRAAAVGLCNRCCKRQAVPGKRRCADCAAVLRGKQSARYRRRRAERRCFSCGTPAERPVCERCQDLRAAARRVREHKRICAGLCIECAEPASHGLVRCGPCREVNALKDRAYRAKRRLDAMVTEEAAE